ncbi:Oxygen tolerance protein BatD [Candidatus Methylobacter favarea]|uniref:Oxygen tolerance protein BatD n=1 Tax=Candidatus Methylobacter favarea TaxID=2707345 RepID=A0A8S0X7V8_9GAMM|nr:BatD family protein [Candidatus Methylobacter favarea]CAA9890407.1 Oxygen tolerance protein BatD [Candidatus Methylobacter favarea]
MRALTLLMNSLVKMKLFFLLSVAGAGFAFAPQQAWAAEIQVSVDRNPVSIDESFQIIFTAAESPDDDPDFSPLEQDFDILSQSQSSNSSWINGKSSKTIQWTLTVMAKQAGDLIIPAVKFGDDITRPLPLLVKSGNAAGKTINTDADLFLEVEATPEDPYVQSQVLYTMRLYRKVDISQASLDEPELAEAVIEKLGEDSNYNTQINGVGYLVTERKYAVFPQKSGQITIKPLVLTAEVVTGNRLGFNGLFNSQVTMTRKISSKAITLTVKPVPSFFTGPHWLPAEQMVLKEQWSGDIKKMKVGEPLTRTLTLLANGTTVGQLPELNNAKTDDKLKTYPDQPVLKEQKKPDGLLAFREEKIALIPSRAGSYTLPAIKVPWFNTQSRKMEVASIPETVITANSAAGSQTAVKPPAVTTVKPQKIESTQTTQPQKNNFWIWASAFLASGWLATLMYFLAGHRAKKPVMENNEVDKSLKDSIKQLKKACTDNNAAAAKDALIEWGQQKFKAASLGAIAAFCDARLRDEILQLNQLLYGREAEQWQGKKLFQAFVENNAREKIAAVEEDSLEPLYRL